MAPAVAITFMIIAWTRSRLVRSILSRRRLPNTHILLVTVILLLWPAGTFAQATPAGHWEGAIALPGASLQIHVDLKQAAGTWQGTIDIPQQGATGLALQAVRFDAPQVHFELQAGPGLAVFDGKLDGDKISGDFSQAGGKFTFSLDRKTGGAAQAGGVSQRAKAGLDGFDDWMNQALKDFKVPGVAVVVVQGDKVVLLKGYGMRDTERQLPVTSRTLFAIGSITKSFTVTTLGMLVDEGKLDWDKPVRNYLPGFRMYDPVATEQMTTRDLVTHRSGLPRHDLVWYSSDFSREDIIMNRLPYLENSKPFRSTFQYNNLMVMTAGYLAGKLNGTTWEEAVEQRLLAPLGMKDTNFSVLDSQKSADFAQPYRKNRETDEVKRIPFYVQGAVGPAGEINSCAADLGRYLLFHMYRGKLEGKQLLSENNSVQMQIPQMVIQEAPAFPELGTNGYGMGLFVSSYRGHKLVEHGGAIDGFTAEFAFLPQDGIGVAVLADLDGTGLPNVVAYSVFDRLLGLPQVAWSQRILFQQEQSKKAEQDAKKKGFVPRKAGTHPSHDLDEYVADYENPGYGIVSITRDGDGFQMKLNRLTETLKHYHYDLFQVPENPLDPLQKMFVMFHTDLNGDISSVSIPLQPDVADIVFTRMPDKQLMQRSVLEAFAGQYDIPGSPVPLTIVLRGDHTLVASAPGQPDLELVPTRGTTFNLKGINGVTFEFKRDTSGKVAEVMLNELGTVLELRKR
jgi:CubicO group peptidase (beta-lactamase class C family)